jgi:hypothetical protein
VPVVMLEPGGRRQARWRPNRGDAAWSGSLEVAQRRRGEEMAGGGAEDAGPRRHGAEEVLAVTDTAGQGARGHESWSLSALGSSRGRRKRKGSSGGDGCRRWW